MKAKYRDYSEWKADNLKELQSDFCYNNENFDNWCFELWEEVKDNTIEEEEQYE